MGFTEAVSSGFRKYTDFKGRSRRSEFWYWTLFSYLGLLAATIVDAVTTGFLLQLVFGLATFLPGLAVAVRRLHDIDKSGWWVLLVFAIVIGLIILIVWYIREGTKGQNRFGPGLHA